MTSRMWFAVVKPDQPIQKKVEYGISITQAVLDTENAKVEDSITRVMMSMDNQNLVIANLSLKHGILQTPLNLHFDKGDSIKLSVPLGSPPVYLYGVTRVEEDELLEAATSKYQPLAAAKDEEASSDDEEAEDSNDDEDDGERDAEDQEMEDDEEVDAGNYKKSSELSQPTPSKLVHTDKKPFICPFCKHRSARKENVARHVIVFHRHAII